MKKNIATVCILLAVMLIIAAVIMKLANNETLPVSTKTTDGCVMTEGIGEQGNISEYLQETVEATENRYEPIDELTSESQKESTEQTETEVATVQTQEEHSSDVDMIEIEDATGTNEGGAGDWE